MVEPDLAELGEGAKACNSPSDWSSQHQANLASLSIDLQEARAAEEFGFYCALALIPVAFLALVALPVWVKPLTIAYKPLGRSPARSADQNAGSAGAASLTSPRS